MRRNDAETMIDRVYEAAAVPELWPAVFEALGRRTDAALGSLFPWKQSVTRWIGTAAAERLISDYVALGRPTFNTRVVRAPPLSQVGFYTDHDVFARDEIDREPFYRDFLHPRGYGWFVGTAFALPTGEVLYFSLERNLARGPFEKKSSMSSTNCDRILVAQRSWPRGLTCGLRRPWHRRFKRLACLRRY
jgi:hypothetical protein